MEKLECREISSLEKVGRYLLRLQNGFEIFCLSESRHNALAYVNCVSSSRILAIDEIHAFGCIVLEKRNPILDMTFGFSLPYSDDRLRTEHQLQEGKYLLLRKTGSFYALPLNAIIKNQTKRL